MGWGNGMAIGWPMTSSSRKAKLGWFTILFDCNNKVYENTYSQQLPQTTYHNGDYVQCDSVYTRVLLGQFVEELPEKYSLRDLSGPAYTECELGYRSIQSACGQGIEEGLATGPINTGIYNTGDYVYSPSLNTRVVLGGIVTEWSSLITISGPTYTSCD